MPKNPVKKANKIIGVVIITMVLVGAYIGFKFLMKRESKPDTQKGTEKIQLPLTYGTGY